MGLSISIPWSTSATIAAAVIRYRGKLDAVAAMMDRGSIFSIRIFLQQLLAVDTWNWLSIYWPME